MKEDSARGKMAPFDTLGAATRFTWKPSVLGSGRTREIEASERLCERSPERQKITAKMKTCIMINGHLSWHPYEVCQSAEP